MYAKAVSLNLSDLIISYFYDIMDLKKFDNAGYAVIHMLWSLIFGGLIQNSQKKINEYLEK